MLVESSRRKWFAIDESDFCIIQQYKWYCTTAGYIASRTGGKHIYLHRLLMRAKPNQIVDHINHDTLDNRRSNLRITTKSVNNQNRKGPNKNSNSKYRGISWDKYAKKWVAKRMINYKSHLIGSFKLLKDAVIAYNKFKTGDK